MCKKIVIELENFGEEEYKYIKDAFNQLENNQISDEKVLIFGELQIDPIRRTVISKGREIALTATEFDILFYLEKRLFSGRRQCNGSYWTYS